MAIISVIIPAFNVEKYINDCILSWVNQTFSDIEIIVVDDASTDSTPEILKKWHEKDARVYVITKTNNSSALTARKAGVEAATGKYIMFSDADDTIEKDACELLYKEIERKPVDILHFNTNIINECNASENDINLLRDFVKPFNGKLYGKNVFLGCFNKSKYKWTLVNKIFKADVCKKAIHSQKDMHILVAEDALTFFYIAYYSNSYRGYLGKGLYNYCYGRGGSGGKLINLELLKRQCSASHAVRAMEHFVLTQELATEYRDAVYRFKNEMINCSTHWLVNNLSEDEKRDGFDVIMNHWKYNDVIASLSGEKIDKYRLSKQLMNAKSLKHQGGSIKTIASYYRTTGIGGVERVLSSLCKMWSEMGYKVIVLTDFRNPKYEYDLPKETSVVVLSDYYNISNKNYAERGKALYSIIKEYKIDLTIYHDWLKEDMLWDALIIKTAGSSFIPYCHGVFTMDLHFQRVGLSNIVAPYLLADAVVTLSETNKSFWSNFNKNVYNLINPFTYSFDDWSKSDCEGKNILWLARISPEKMPFDTLKIMKEVLKTIPEAKLHIVGSSINSKYEKKLKNAVLRMGLRDNVILYGAQTDVMKFYREASVFLMTSEFEGYPMALQESMLSGLPTVMYDLPYLTLVKNNHGIIRVEQGNYVSAGAAIVDLLLDTKKRKEIGNYAREFIEGFRDYDFKGTWKNIIESVSCVKEFDVSLEQREMMETLVTDQNFGMGKTKDATYYAQRKAVRLAIKLIKVKDYILHK